ncbi:MAG TPA: cellulase family glycosylhydrolase [Candidatus Limnocylindria bacterium]|nr:cellulase family glycosylhydrolase [Candidatus Limnocylindria bacterium]
MRTGFVLIVLLALAVAPARALDGRRLRVHDGRLVDERRREVTLRGVNARVEGIFDVTFDDGRLPLEPIPVFDDGDAATMARFGFNLLRLPISWSALEPARGRFDAAYLDRIAAVVAVCRAHGILVLLDFHQDAFSKEIGEDGAPRWVLDLLLGPNNYPYLGGPLTDLGARRTAPATLAAFRQFFLDTGGVQEDFAAAAVVLGRRFAREPAVLGYEILNEPLAFLTPNGDAALRTFHQRVARAIREVDRRHLIAFEPDVLRNLTNRAPIPATPFPVRGALYAPHIYTDVFDGHDYSSGDPAELAPSMERAAAEATGWGAPLLVGEYGIDPNAPNANAWITAELDLQDRLRAHSAFWLWEEISQGRWGLFDGESSEPGGERIGRTTALSRVYARAVPGRVLEHAFDAGANTLRLRWAAHADAPLELFVPARRFPRGFALRCDGKPVAAPPGPIVTLRCGRGRGDHLLELEPAP